MDSVKKLIGICFVLSGIAFSSCIREGEGDCGRYVRFVFDYNLQEVDAFHRHTSQIDLYLFDADGIYMGSIHQETDDYFPEKYGFRLPEMYRDAVQFVAWGGLHKDDFVLPQLVPHESTLEDLQVCLQENSDYFSQKNFHSLLHGYAEQAFNGVSSDTITLRMTNNTNNIRIVMRAKDQDFTVPVSLFNFEFRSKNSSYDGRNRRKSDQVWTYAPFYMENEASEQAVVVEISTLRLFSAQENWLEIVQKDASEPIIDEDLNSLFRLMQVEDNKQKYGFQEYLDRKDEYSILILLEREETPGGDYRYFSTSIKVLPWTERPQPVG